jgi:hypothetical protein
VAGTRARDRSLARRLGRRGLPPLRFWGMRRESRRGRGSPSGRHGAPRRWSRLCPVESGVPFLVPSERARLKLVWGFWIGGGGPARPFAPKAPTGSVAWARGTRCRHREGPRFSVEGRRVLGGRRRQRAGAMPWPVVAVVVVAFFPATSRGAVRGVCVRGDAPDKHERDGGSFDGWTGCRRLGGVWQVDGKAGEGWESHGEAAWDYGGRGGGETQVATTSREWRPSSLPDCVAFVTAGGKASGSAGGLAAGWIPGPRAARVAGEDDYGTVR